MFQRGLAAETEENVEDYGSTKKARDGEELRLWKAKGFQELRQ